MRGYPRPCTGPRPIVAGFRSKGQDRSRDRTGLDLRSGSQEKSCGVGLRGFESHPPHHRNAKGPVGSGTLEFQFLLVSCEIQEPVS